LKAAAEPDHCGVDIERPARLVEGDAHDASHVIGPGCVDDEGAQRLLPSGPLKQIRLRLLPNRRDPLLLQPPALGDIADDRDHQDAML
jgi:hypothetical protein